MYSEHILYSVGLAILIGALYKYWYGRAIPVWIIAACAWVPDYDYIPHHIIKFLNHGNLGMIVHGDFHNVFAMFGLSALGAYILYKYMRYDFGTAFVCMNVGILIHFICDYFVYPSVLHPFSRIFYDTCFVGLNLIPEEGQLYRIGEIHIMLLGILIILVALIAHVYVKDIKQEVT